MCDEINVKDYGAVGNGTGDDSPEINAAIAAAVADIGSYNDLYRTVCFPRGVYRCLQSLNIPIGLAIRGQPGGSILDFTGLSSGAALECGTSDSSLPSAAPTEISGLALFGPGSTSGVIGMRLGSPSNSGSLVYAQNVIRNCFIKNFGVGLRPAKNCFINKFEHVYIGHNGIGLDADGDYENWGENICFDFCMFAANNQHLNINPASGGGIDFTFRNCSLDYAAATPEAVVGAATQVLFDGCHWETDQLGSANSPLLVRIVYPLGQLTFRNVDFVFAGGSPSGVPVYWDSGSASTGMRLTFDCCNAYLFDAAATFYGTNASFSGSQPTALAIQSGEITGATGKMIRPEDQRWATAAPTSGTWKRGDKVWDQTPSAGGWMGWVCVTAGSPGTWKGFGLVQS